MPATVAELANESNDRQKILGRKEQALRLGIFASCKLNARKLQPTTVAENPEKGGHLQKPWSKSATG